MTDGDRDSLTQRVQRLNELELLFTHLQRTMQDLDGVVLAQQKQIDGIQKQLALLTAQMKSIADGIAEPRRLEDEVPPHY